jgi:hypothetical protein
MITTMELMGFFARAWINPLRNIAESIKKTIRIVEVISSSPQRVGESVAIIEVIVRPAAIGSAAVSAA